MKYRILVGLLAALAASLFGLAGVVLADVHGTSYHDFSDNHVWNLEWTAAQDVYFGTRIPPTRM